MKIHRLYYTGFLLSLGYVFSSLSCSSFTGGSGASTSSDDILPAEKAFANSRIVKQKGCLSCHTVGKSGGTVGPILNQVANRRTIEWLRKWLKDPNAVREGTKMPNFQFSESELDEIVSYIQNLKRELKTEEITAKSIPLPEKGELLFNEYDCYACHRIGSSGRFIGPNLTWVGKRKSEDWEQVWLKDPPAYKPDTFMPNFHLPDDQIEALTAFLHSLQGQKNEEAKGWEGNVIFFLDSRPREIGEMIYRRFGCDGCHGQRGEGGHKNINTTTDEIPMLLKTAREYTKEEIKEIILAGKQPEKLDQSGPSPLACPPWSGAMTEEEAEYIYEFLVSIAPKKKRFRFGE